MDDKELLAVMGYVSTMDEKQKSSTLQPSITVTVTATEQEATATVTATQNTAVEAANLTTTEEVNLPETTTTVPPSPQDPAVIELNKKTRPSPHNLVTIDPRCFHCDGRTEIAARKEKNKSINTIVKSIVDNNLTPQQRALALKLAMVHPEVRALAKSAGLIDDKDYIKKNYILNNIKNAITLAQETTKTQGRANDDRRSLVQSVVLSLIPTTQ